MGTLRDSDPFWLDDENVHSLQEILCIMRTESGWTPKKLSTEIDLFMQKYMKRHNTSIAVVGSKAIFHFTHPEPEKRTYRPSNLVYLSQLALLVDRQLHTSGRTRENVRINRVLADTKVIDRFLEYCRQNDIDLDGIRWSDLSEKEKMSAFYKDTATANSHEEGANIIRSLYKMLKVDRFSSDVGAMIFPLNGNVVSENYLRRYFVVYRYSLSQNEIARMFCVFQSGSSALPFPSFKIFYMDVDNTKVETDGLIMGTRFATYLFGAMEGGLALNVISIPTALMYKDHFPGLMLGADTRGNVMSARLFFQETSARHDAEVPIGTCCKNDVAACGGQFPKWIRNEVAITPDDVCMNGSSVPGDQLRFVMERYLMTDDVGAVFTHGDGQPFNPADPEHLPFDTALVMLR